MTEQPRERFIDRHLRGEFKYKSITEEFFLDLEEWIAKGKPGTPWDWIGISKDNFERFLKASEPCGCSECRWRRSPW